MPTSPNILFFDLEVNPKSLKILLYGGLCGDKQYKGNRQQGLIQLSESANIICGHNSIAHDLPILKQHNFPTTFFQKLQIDTLYLSALLFPKKPYHPLVKDYQLQGDEINNPLEDAKLARTVFLESLEAFELLAKELKLIFTSLLHQESGFDGFFKCISNTKVNLIVESNVLADYITNHFEGAICEEADLLNWIEKTPIELAFALANIAVGDKHSILPKWIQHEFPQTLELIDVLRVNCLGRKGCPYCDHLSPVNGLKRFFGYDQFKSFEGDGEEPLQEQVVKAALAEKSLLCIFPTGGGKSLTFQLPALMKGAANKSLTVVISPLQSLMKDQVDVLKHRHEIFEGETINGLLSPLERMEVVQKVENGGANLLYISPESLRSNSIIRLLKNRIINRFVIDEAHCFSSWGQDFRVDYLYIGKFIKKLQALKGLTTAIPISCFTATAKPAVVTDIQKYFKEIIGVDLLLFQTKEKRKNLKYHVIKVGDKQEKYEKLRDLLQTTDGAKIVYVSRVKRAIDLVERLRRDRIVAKAYYGKLDSGEKIKIQDEFKSEEDDLDIIVATSAFGMGVDKENVKMVVHYNISDSLENYMQESGRAGRKANMQAECIVLFDEKDLEAHFSLLNLTKLSRKEVYMIWQGIKKFRRKKFSKSALEIAKMAGWDTEMMDLETRVKVAIAALEESGYVRREENAPQIFAQSILVNSVDSATQKMNSAIHNFNGQEQYDKAKRVFGSLISRAKARTDTRVDSIAESLLIEKNEVTSILNVFKSIGILSNEKDLSAYYFTVKGKRNSKNTLERVIKIEKEIFNFIFPNDKVTSKKFILREINESINEKGIDCDLSEIRDILNYWAQIYAIKKERIDRINNRYHISLKIPHSNFRENIEKRIAISLYCLQILEEHYLPEARDDENFSDRKLLEFSMVDLKLGIEKLTAVEEPMRLYEFVLLYFHHLKVLELKDGLLVFYNPMKITREIEDNKKRYGKEDYTQLANHYEQKTEQIHIVGEYARKQLENNILATQFVDDYFTLPYDEFLQRHFRMRKGQIRRPITQKKFIRIIKDLSSEQLEIIKDKASNKILVAAGPGSGKTRILVHKVAALLLMEDVKPEQFLMLTFSRPAAQEFKIRLKELVGPLAYEIDIFTFHGFAFQLKGRLGDLDRSKDVLEEVSRDIESENIPIDRIQSKSVIVIDEYQDVSAAEYKFISAIIKTADAPRVMVVGDDDQNIYEFRGSSIKFMRDFETQQNATTYYLTKNFRSKYNLLEFTNRFLQKEFSEERIKKDIELIAHDQRNGVLEIVNYSSNNIILPVVAAVKAKQLTGTTAILTPTNEAAVLLASMLKEQGHSVSLIAEKQGFALAQLLEVKSFTHQLFAQVNNDIGFMAEDLWNKTKNETFSYYSTSHNLDLFQRILAEFESNHAKKFKNEWIDYLKEIRVEEFYHAENDKVIVSTMHKSKGKEFDNVVILLEDYKLESEEQKRVLYVAMTRAKVALSIHSNGVQFRVEKMANLEKSVDANRYPAPNRLILEFGMKDVLLGFFKEDEVVYNVKNLKSGDLLFPSKFKASVFDNAEKEKMVELSSQGKDRIDAYLKKDYRIERLAAKYIVIWYDEARGREYRVVLPEVWLCK